SAEIGRIDLPSDAGEVSTRHREMARGGEKLGQQHQRPGELQRFGPLALRRDLAKPRLHRNYVAPRVSGAASGRRVCLPARHAKKRGPPFRGPLAVRGYFTPAYRSSMPGILASLRSSGGKLMPLLLLFLAGFLLHIRL